MSASALRVLHAPHNVGNHPANLAAGERALGLNSRCLSIFRSALQYNTDECLALDDYSRRRRRAALARRFTLALEETDIFHFNFGQSFVYHAFDERRRPESGRDAARIHAAGKPMFMTWQGCDARQQAYVQSRFAVAACHDARCWDGVCNPARDRGRAEDVAFWKQYAARQFCLNPDLVRMVPDSDFLPYAILPPPGGRPRPEAHRRLRVVHAPTQRATKGSAYICAAMEILQGELDVEFQLVEGLPHHEALRVYAEADLAIDQVLVGWYGGFAVELMHLGIPVAAFIRADDMAYVPTAMRDELPIINTPPDTLVDVLRYWLRRPDALAKRGEQSRAFAAKWHHPESVAQRTARVYTDPTAALYSESEGRPARGPAHPDADRTVAPVTFRA